MKLLKTNNRRRTDIRILQGAKLEVDTLRCLGGTRDVTSRIAQRLREKALTAGTDTEIRK